MNAFSIIVYALWFISEALLNRLMRSSKDDRKNSDKGSLAIIWVAITAGITLAVFVSGWSKFAIGPFETVHNLGLEFLLLGILLRLWIISTLGRFFTVDVTIRKDHQLKKDGFYKYIRHPSYAASLISFIGFGISVNNWLSLILIMAIIIFVFRIRIIVEEKALAEHFGAEYLEYKRRTKALIPFIY